MTELKTLLQKQWTKRDGTPDERMVDYSLKSNKWIDMGDYYLNVSDSKPSIDKTLWYDDETDSPDDSKFEAFRVYNLRGNKAPQIEDYINDGRPVIWVYTNYTHDQTGGKVKSWTATRIGEEPRHIGEYRLATTDEIGAIKQGLNEVRVDFEKRLKTYWKRYSNKVHASGYWANR